MTGGERLAEQLAMGWQPALDDFGQNFNAKMFPGQRFAIQIEGHVMGGSDFQPREMGGDDIFVFFVVEQAAKERRQKLF